MTQKQMEKRMKVTAVRGNMVLRLLACLKMVPGEVKVPVCMRNKIIVKTANLIIRDVDSFVLALMMTKHPPEEWDAITDFCTSLRENLIA